MSLGENIQKYRKSLGLSQEELGQKLLVSRQTISLWEKDQTVPTIDNLIRLKEVFNVSVDEILGLESKIQSEETQPNEACKYKFSKDELKKIYRSHKWILYKFAALTALFPILSILFCIFTSLPDRLLGVSIGFLLCTVAVLIGVTSVYNKSWRKSINRACETTYEYKIYEDYLILCLYRNNEKVLQSKCSFSDIEQIRLFGEWFSLQISGQLFIVRKSDLKENSAFYSFMYKNPTKAVDATHLNKWRTASVSLTVVSWLLILVSGTLSVALIKMHILYPENMWFFFLLAPVPIASTVFGFVLKSKGYKYKLSIYFGILITLAFCILGSLTFIY